MADSRSSRQFRLLAAVIIAIVATVVDGASVVQAETGVSDGEILIGGSGALSGPLGVVGEDVRHGVELYVKALNDAGGIHGRKVRTIYYDDHGRPDRAVANTQKLVEQDGVFAIVASQGTVPVVATLDYLERSRIPLLFPQQGSPVVRGRRFVFSGMALFDRQARLIVDYLVGQRHVKTVAALYQDDPYGKSFRTFFENDLHRHGLRLVAAEAVKPVTTDVYAQVTALRAANPEVTLLAVTPGAGTQALKDRLKIGWTGSLMVVVGPFADERYVSVAGTAADGVEGLVLWPDPLASDLPGVKRYREHLAKYFPRNEPTRASLSGYVAAMLFAEAATRAGRSLTRDGLITALESLKQWDGGVLPPISIGPDHETQKHGLWVRLENARFKVLTDWLRAP